MNYSIQDLSKTKVEIALDIEKGEWDKAIEEAYQKNKHQYFIEGFRKGKVPRNVLEKRYGKEFFYDEALDLALPKYFGEILDKDNIDPAGRPEVDVKEVSEDGVKVVFVVEVMPKFTLGAYKGLKINKVKTDVTDEQVEAEIQSEREKHARFVSREDKAVEKGDTVILDYSGTVDGVKFDGGTAENQTLEIGSGAFIPGFEDQMIGMKLGEEKDLNVRFPDQYGAENLAGKDSVFHVKVNEIKVKELPDLDDEFANLVSEFETMDAYKADVKARLVKDAEERAKYEEENILLDTIVDGTEIELPEVLIREETERMMQDLEQRLMYQGMKLDDYLKFMGTDAETFKKERRGEAERSVKSRLVLEELIKTEKLNVTMEDVDKKLEEIASKQERKVENLKKELNEQILNRIMNQLMIDKLFDFLRENNTVA